MPVLHIQPPREIQEFHRELEQMFGGMLNPRANGGTPAMPVDFFETPDSFVVRLELPGVAEADVEVSFQDGTLAVRGEKRAADVPKEWTCHRSERRFGAFHREATLPAPVAADGITADLSKGVLTVTLPKREEAKPKTIRVTAKDA